MTDPIKNNRTDIELPVAVANEIWQKALESSAALAMARHIDLPGTGVAVPIVTGDPTAEWVGETDEAPVSESAWNVKYITPYKMSTIELVSKEMARDYNKLYSVLLDRLPYAIADAFDKSVFGYAGAPGDGFDTLANIETQDLSEDVYQGFVAANGKISVAGYRANGIVLDPNGETLLYASVDDVKRPLFIPSVNAGGNGIGTVLGKPVSVREHVGIAGNAADLDHDIPARANTVGFIADWRRAVAGIVKNITIDIADKVTVNKGGSQINVWQRDMVAIKATFEGGFAIEDEDAFVRLTTPFTGV